MDDTTAIGHLVLQRRVGESVRIGTAEVTVQRIRGGRASLLVTAPRELPIVRGELSPLETPPEYFDRASG